MDQILLAPVNYIAALPSKGVRDILIDALNLCYGVQVESSEMIRSIVKLLPNLSLT
jgi:hypothetical protein